MNSDIMGAIWTIASVTSGALLGVGGIVWSNGSHLGAWFWFMLSCLPIIVSTVIWAPMANDTIWKFVLPGTVGAIGGAVILIGATQILASGGAVKMPANDKPPSGANHTGTPHSAIATDNNSVVGEEIIGNNQGGVVREIISNGVPGGPSFGQELNVTGRPGQNITGSRVIQSGPGTGSRIIQSGPGIGSKITVTDKPE